MEKKRKKRTTTMSTTAENYNKFEQSRSMCCMQQQPNLCERIVSLRLVPYGDVLEKNRRWNRCRAMRGSERASDSPVGLFTWWQYLACGLTSASTRSTQIEWINRIERCNFFSCDRFRWSFAICGAALIEDKCIFFRSQQIHFPQHHNFRCLCDWNSRRSGD